MQPREAFLQARALLVEHREAYGKAREAFRWPALDTFNWALDWFDVQAAGNDRPALWLVEENGTETKVSFQELSRRSNRVANALRDLGVKRGDGVLIMLDNVLPLWEVMLACIKLGAVLVPSTLLLSEADLKDRIERGGIRHLVVDASQTGKFAAMDASLTRIIVGAGVGTGVGAAPGWHGFESLYGGADDYGPDAPTRATDPMLLYFTSGTTAKPKLVLHTHQSYPVGHLSTMYWVGLREGDIHYNISSPGWAKHAWSSFFAPWNAGACIFVYRAARFNAATTLQVIVDKGVTTLCAPPTVWRLFIQEDLAAYQVKLRELVGAGEPLNPEVISQVQKAWGLTIRDGYGQTETTAQVGNPPGQPVKAGSMGRPLPGYEVVLLDAEGHEAEEGEIALKLKPRPLGLMAGYRDDPSKMAKAEAEGFYRTGDVATRDADGYLFFVGRADDVFKSSDYRISPFELESFLIEHEAVAEAAVVPSPDPLKLAVPKAYVILRAGVEPSRETALALFRFIRERLSPYKRIRILEFGDLPKTISGKIRRVELRKRAAEQTHGPAEFREDQFPELR
ncbi:AMP-dependent synthetase [Geothrix limicola]|uniref:AMP-dependent synthetase n=1 Tax=Geothrix limicola TaxID=2927978 RepID=A0ABQ5QIC4_9BACT|nr:AMP-binding protein [Geothrix limicola]GLH74619.1 AMP-dependent synthetase [Geothrix limicola]